MYLEGCKSSVARQLGLQSFMSQAVG